VKPSTRVIKGCARMSVIDARARTFFWRHSLTSDLSSAEMPGTMMSDGGCSAATSCLNLNSAAPGGCCGGGFVKPPTDETVDVEIVPGPLISGGGAREERS